jgi:ankyrin repeat protein
MELAKLILPTLKSLSQNNAIKLLKNGNLLNTIWEKLNVNVQSTIQKAAERVKIIEDKDSLIEAINNQEELAHLLGQGANPNRLGSKGKTPLMTAIEQGNLTAVKLLLGVSSLIIKDKGGNGLTQYLKSASEDIQKAVYGYMTENMFKAVDSKSGKDQLTLLLLAGGDPNELGPNGTTLLMEAVKKGSVAIVKELLNRKANPEMLDKDGNGLDHYVGYIITRAEQQVAKNEALNEADLGILKLIAPHLGKITPEMARRITLIHLLQQIFNDAETTLSVRISIDNARRAYVLFADDPDKANLDILVSNINDAPRLAAFLVAGSNPNRLSNQGELPLIAAVKESRMDAVQELMMRGADIHMKNQEGKAASDYVTNSKGDMYKLFKAYEAMEKQFKEKFENKVLESLTQLGDNYKAEDLAKLVDDALKEAYKPGFAEKMIKGSKDPLITQDTIGRHCEFYFITKFFMWLESKILGKHSYEEIKTLKIMDRVYNEIYNTQAFRDLTAGTE